MLKNIISRLALPALLLFAVMSSCKKNEKAETENLPTISSADAMQSFAKVLSKAVTDKSVREFLKTESLTKFDRDYDVFYPMIKDKIVSNGVSFKDYLNNLAKELKLSNDITTITSKLPLLTILVPETEIFSAEKWNTETTVPIVGIRDVAAAKNGQKLIAYTSEWQQKELDYHAEPTEAIIILKDNEALEAVKTNVAAKSLQINTYSYSEPHQPVLTSDGLSYYFADEALYNRPAGGYPTDEEARAAVNNNAARPEGGACDRLGNYPYFDPRVQQAYEKGIYNPICPDNTATVRDYIYYGIDPTTGVTHGPLNYSYREYITSIKCDNLTARSRFDDLGEGSVLDFDIIIYTADADPIFPLKKRLSIQKANFFLTDVDNPTPRAFDLVGVSYTGYVPVELAVWNFKRQGDIWKFGVFEFDPGTTVSQTKSVSATLGTNFSIGEEKEGGKFGISATVTATKSTTITYTDGSDDLGEAVLYWCDPIIKSTIIETSNTQAICGLPHLRRPVRKDAETGNRMQSNTWGRTNEISTGTISMTIEPILKP